MANELVQFLHVFRLASKALESFLTPTIHLVAFWRKRLVDHLQPVLETNQIASDAKDDPSVEFAADYDKILAIKELILNQIEEKFHLSPLHAAAAYLNPNFKWLLPTLGLEEDIIEDGM